MKVAKTIFNEKYQSLILDKNNEIKETKTLEYLILIQSREEYEFIENIIVDAVLQEIEVYQASSNFEKLRWYCNKILTSNDFIVIFTTNDESKFDLLEKRIKEIMIKNKEFLN